MMRTLPALAALALLAAAPLAAAGEGREIRRSFPASPGQAVRIDFTVGALRVEAGDGSEVQAELSARCRWNTPRCRERLEEIDLAGRARPSRLHIEVTGLAVWQKTDLELEARFVVPRGLPLEIDMGVGELEVSGFEADVWVDLGVGEAEISLPAAKVASVTVDVGVGEATLHAPDSRLEGRRSRLLGSEVEWDEGKGSARVRVEVGVGELTLDLE